MFAAARLNTSLDLPVLLHTVTVKDPATFLAAISRPRRNLAAIAPLASALGDSFPNIFRTSSLALKKAGVPVKERRYFLWAREKFRQGEDPAKFVKDAKPKKIVRGYVFTVLLCGSLSVQVLTFLHCI